MTEAEKQTIVDELKDWAIITGRPLPYPAEIIAQYEARGFVVDLADGSISDAEDCMTRTVALSSHGRMGYNVLCGGRIYEQGWPIERCENEDQRRGYMATLNAEADAETERFLANHRQAVAA